MHTTRLPARETRHVCIHYTHDVEIIANDVCLPDPRIQGLVLAYAEYL